MNSMRKPINRPFDARLQVGDVRYVAINRGNGEKRHYGLYVKFSEASLKRLCKVVTDISLSGIQPLVFVYPDGWDVCKAIMPEATA